MRVSDIDVEVVLREVDLVCGCGFAMVFDFSVAFWLMNFTLELFPHLFSSRVVPLEILLPSPPFVISLNLEFPGPSLRDLSSFAPPKQHFVFVFVFVSSPLVPFSSHHSNLKLYPSPHLSTGPLHPAPQPPSATILPPSYAINSGK